LRLFVYGSLLSGEANAGVLARAGARLVGPARTEPRYTLFDLGPYPALAAGGTTAVEGEVYEVDAAGLTAVDAFEGHPDEYRRGIVDLVGGAPAQAYLLPGAAHPGARALPGGNWRTR
jgi:gamma-glutamylaminecyclotransferase